MSILPDLQLFELSLSLSEATVASGIKPDTFRNWLKRGLVEVGRKNPSGRYEFNGMETLYLSILVTLVEDYRISIIEAKNVALSCMNRAAPVKQSLVDGLPLTENYHLVAGDIRDQDTHKLVPASDVGKEIVSQSGSKAYVVVAVDRIAERCLELIFLLESRRDQQKEEKQKITESQLSKAPD